MRLPKLDYVAPGSLGEVLSLLSQHKSDAKLMGGGTDLLVRMMQKVATPHYVVDIKKIPELDYVRLDRKGGLKIGSLVTLHTLEKNKDVARHFPVIAEAAGKVASPQIRNRATIGGNICLDSRCWYFNQSQQWRRSRPPCFKTGGAICHVVKGGRRCYSLFMADTVPPLISMGATARIVSSQAERVLPLEKLYTGVGDHVIDIKPEEMLTEVALPPVPSLTATSYIKLSLRQAVDFPLVSAAATVTLDDRKKTCVDCRIVVGAVSSAPLRALKAEKELQGQAVSPELLEKVGEVALKEAGAIVHIGAPVDYKRNMVKEMVAQAVAQAWQRAKALQKGATR